MTVILTAKIRLSNNVLVFIICLASSYAWQRPGVSYYQSYDDQYGDDSYADVALVFASSSVSDTLPSFAMLAVTMIDSSSMASSADGVDGVFTYGLKRLEPGSGQE